MTNIFFVSKGIEAPPIYMYSMYAKPAKASPTEVFYVLEYDGQLHNAKYPWNNYKKLWFNYSMPFYDHTFSMKDKFAYLRHDDYPHWLKRYLSAMLNKPIGYIKVWKVEAIYLPDGSIKELKRSVVCES